MRKYYECHITIDGHPELVEHALSNRVGWKFSAIHGDPILGKKTFCYLTTHMNFNKRLDEVVLLMKMEASAVEKIFAKMDLNWEDMRPSVVRQKVELVLYDTKSIKEDA